LPDAGPDALALDGVALLDAVPPTDAVTIEGIAPLAAATGSLGSCGAEATADSSCGAVAAAVAAAGGREVSRPAKKAITAISATKTSPAVAISHFGMCIGHALV
jgi:hypothetical protein